MVWSAAYPGAAAHTRSLAAEACPGRVGRFRHPWLPDVWLLPHRDFGIHASTAMAFSLTQRPVPAAPGDFGIHASTLEIKEYNGKKSGYRSGRRTKLQTGMSVLHFFAAVGGAQPATGSDQRSVPMRGSCRIEDFGIHAETGETTGIKHENIRLPMYEKHRQECLCYTMLPRLEGPNRLRNTDRNVCATFFCRGWWGPTGYETQTGMSVLHYVAAVGGAQPATKHRQECLCHTMLPRLVGPNRLRNTDRNVCATLCCHGWWGPTGYGKRAAGGDSLRSARITQRALADFSGGLLAFKLFLPG